MFRLVVETPQLRKLSNAKIVGRLNEYDIALLRPWVGEKMTMRATDKRATRSVLRIVSRDEPVHVSVEMIEKNEPYMPNVVANPLHVHDNSKTLIHKCRLLSPVDGHVVDFSRLWLKSSNLYSQPERLWTSYRIHA